MNSERKEARCVHVVGVCRLGNRNIGYKAIETFAKRAKRGCPMEGQEFQIVIKSKPRTPAADCEIAEKLPYCDVCRLYANSYDFTYNLVDSSKYPANRNLPVIHID